MRCLVAASTCLLCSVAWTRLASAQDSNANERIALSYQAPHECPTQSQFEAQVSQRVAFRWLASETDRFARPLRVEVVRAQGFWQAQLTYRDNDGQGLTRSVTAASCESSVAAIALATALLIETLVDEGAARSPQSDAAPPPNAAPPARAPSAAQTTPRAVTQRGSQVTAPGAPPLTASSTTSLSPSPARRPELGVSLAVLPGLSPSPAYGLTVLAGIPIASMLPRLGVAVYQSGLSPTDLPGVRIRARLLALSLEECPLSIRGSSLVSVPICVGAGSGILTISSQMDPTADATGKRSSDFWLMAALSPRFRVQGRWMFVQLGPDLVVPLTRREFVVTRDAGRLEPAYRTPVVTIGVQSTLGVQF